MITSNTTLNLALPKNYATVNEWLNAGHCSQELLNYDFSFIDSLNKLQAQLDYQFRSQQALISSLTHKSFFFENKEWAFGDNEKLEFIGDSVVNFIISKKLYLQFTSLNEGELSKLRNSLVNEESFSKLALSIQLSNNLFIGKGELKNGGHLRPSLLSNAFEAIIGAIYFDSGSLDIVENVLDKIIKLYEKENEVSFFNLTHINHFDSKSKLQELIMAKSHCTPEYRSIEIPNGFEVELLVDGRSLGKLQGISKKKLEKELAKIVLDKNIF